MDLSYLRASLAGHSNSYEPNRGPNSNQSENGELQAQLTDLAKQLSSQMDYNNELLGQIQRLEEAQLAAQKAATEKQSSLRQAMSIAEAARAEASDLRRKLAVAQVRSCHAVVLYVVVC